MPFSPKSAKTILVVDDIESNIHTVLAILEDFDVIPVTSGTEALKVLQEEKVDLILLDIMMPEMNGFETCQRIKENPATAEIPIIFLTAKSDEDSIEHAYQAGGFDYITKPFLPRELTTRVKFHLRFQELFQELDRLASFDTLTGIYNRRKFFESAKKIYADANCPLYALMLDIDHFKNINDKYGHATGDTALICVTQSISESLTDEPNSVFGRLGGEEFAILLYDKTPEQVMSVAEKIRMAIADKVIYADDGSHFSLSISIGMAHRTSHTTLDHLLHEADLALYSAKDGGRNRTIFRGV